jgi:hypothetical protein
MMTEDSPARPAVEPAPKEAVPEQAGGGLHWWQRLLPVSGIAAVVLALVTYAFPGLDDELEVSTSRKQHPFVELYLTSPPGAVCASDSPQVRFRVESHLKRVRTLGYRIGVDPAGSRAQTVRKRGRTRIAPGQAKSLRRKVSAPVGTAYDLTVRLQHRPERLRIHCDGTPR